MTAKTARIGMGNGDRLIGHLNGIHRRFRTDMRQIDNNTEPVHLAHRIHAKIAQTAIGSLPATATQQIGLVIGQLNHAHTQSEKQPQAI